MAAPPDSTSPETRLGSSALPTNSYDTSLCIIPPRHLWPAIDRLRVLYDKAYGKWPPHLNLVYPFVQVQSLERAVESIQSSIAARRQQDKTLSLRLDSADVFPHRHNNTIFRHDSDKGRTKALQDLRRDVLSALGQHAKQFRLHLTVAQSDDANNSAHTFLYQKVRLLPALEWEVDRLYVLVRERSQVDGVSSSVLKEWGSIDLRSGAFSRLPQPTGFYQKLLGSSEDEAADDETDWDAIRAPYHYDHDSRLWKQLLDESTPSPTSQQQVAAANRREFTVASYNVLAEFEHPPSQARYPLITKSILSQHGLADMLFLQEVTDDFLTYLLGHPDIRAAYPFVSHGPPDQLDIEPLPSFLNMVVLSRRPFDWEWVPFARQHKGSVVARLREGENGDEVGKWEDGEFLPLVVATVHLTHGLADGAVSAKTGELKRVLRFLADRYEGHPQVLLGDFNIATSRRTIEAALRAGDITTHTAGCLAGLEEMLVDSGLVDAWQTVASRREEEGEDEDGEQSNGSSEGDEVPGERGATFEPTTNAIAAKMVGAGANNRPQRYDRILVKGEDVLDISAFNKFGLVSDKTVGPDAFASDHWGVRCFLTKAGGGVGEDTAMTGVETEATSANEAAEGAEEAEEGISDEIAKLVVPVELKKATGAVEDIRSLTAALSDAGAFPTEEEAEARRSALELLKSVITETNPTAPAAPAPGVTGEARSADDHQASRRKSPLIFVPVGSYGLGVWTSASDVDVLCIGPYSSSTFFALATQRIRKASSSTTAAAAKPIRLLRRVRANTGTMLELEVAGIKMDLQYCAATAVAEQWPAVLALPASDPVFALPAQTLGKLKAARDMDYLLGSLPDLVQFRLAHRAVKTWAKSRGIYSARFGYLGGIHISVLLARVCKLLLQPVPSSSSGSSSESISSPETSSSSSLTVTDILVTFFAHYASFDWAAKMAFDPFFHRRKLTSYTRWTREPLSILGYFPPVLNTAHAASAPSVQTIAEEFRRADALLSRTGVTWPEFFSGGAATDFLRAYKSYVRIELQYWGMSLARGAQFVGWLESRCPSVLVDISRRLPGVHARIWPARFVDAGGSAGAVVAEAAAAAAVEERDYQGCYLIGLGRLQQQQQQQHEGAAAAAAAAAREEQRVATDALLTVLRRFEDLIRGCEKYYDSSCQWMSASVVRRADLGELVPDSREWGQYTAGDDEDGEDEEEEEEEDPAAGDDSWDDDAEASSSAKAAKKVKKVNKMGKKGSRATAGAPPTAPRPAGAKFRTAADAMNRLRWDPSLDSGDFIVGYEDRFKGAQEKALDAWKTEVSDEEFIPQHRILYFKRRSDGVVVWERRTRKDELFGGGDSSR